MKINALLASLLLTSAPLMAGEPAPLAPAPQKSPWDFTTSLYLWGMGIEGSVGVLGLESGSGVADLNLGFDDLVSQLEFAYMGTFELRRGRWGVTADLIYTQLGAEVTGRGPFRVGAECDLKQFIGNFRLNYRLVDTERAAFDVFAGARVNWIDVGLELKGPRGRRLNLSAERDWVDPVIGFRTRLFMNDSWFVQASADVGSGSSDLTWQALGLVGYRFNAHCSTGLGYRALGTDYREGGFTYDTTAHGPILGVEWKF